MAVESVTLNLPRSVYKAFQRLAEQKQRAVDELLVEAVTAVAPSVDAETFLEQTPLAQMSYLNDAALWQAAHTTMTEEQRVRLAALHDKQQQVGLGPDEQAEEARLLKLYRETLLVRAQAAALLQQRNYDVADPTQFSSTE